VTKSADNYLELYDACVAAGGSVLLKFAATLIDHAATGSRKITLEQLATGVVGMWRVEVRQILKRRGLSAATIDCSADARALHDALTKYANSEEYASDKRNGVAANSENAGLFQILQAYRGEVRSVRTLRRRKRIVGQVA